MKRYVSFLVLVALVLSMTTGVLYAEGTKEYRCKYFLRLDNIQVDESGGDKHYSSSLYTDGMVGTVTINVEKNKSINKDDGWNGVDYLGTQPQAEEVAKKILKLTDIKGKIIKYNWYVIKLESDGIHVDGTVSVEDNPDSEEETIIVPPDDDPIIIPSGDPDKPSVDPEPDTEDTEMVEPDTEENTEIPNIPEENTEVTDPDTPDEPVIDIPDIPSTDTEIEEDLNQDNPVDNNIPTDNKPSKPHKAEHMKGDNPPLPPEADDDPELG